MNLLRRSAPSPLLFLDLETGGLDAGSHEILELGAVLTSADGTAELGRISARVRPLHPERISPVAQAINGYSPEGWVDARPLGEVLVDLLGLARGATLVGHNVCFDWGFILTALRNHRIEWTGNGRWLDTMSLAPFAPGLQDRRLLTMADHLGIPVHDAHRALADAELCRSVFLRLAPSRRRPFEALLPDEVVRRSPIGPRPQRRAALRSLSLRAAARLLRRGAVSTRSHRPLS